MELSPEQRERTLEDEKERLRPPQRAIFHWSLPSSPMKRAAFVAAFIVIAVLVAGGAPQQKTGTTPTRQPSNWDVSTSKNKIDDVVTTIVRTSSIDDPAARLAIRCGGGTAEVYVTTGDLLEPQLGGGHTIRFR